LRRLRTALLAIAVGVIAAGTMSSAAGASTMRLGFFDWRPLTGTDSAQWLPKAQQVGGQVVRDTFNWASIAPKTLPAGFVASDPNAPGYSWSAVDAQIKTLRSAGFDVLLTVQTAPTWAEGSGRPSTDVAPTGTWRPDPTALADFFTALATRYSGTFPDPAGGTLPKVDEFQVWNEPNLWKYLSPQWTKSGKGYAIASPGIYRSLLNASYAAIKKVQPSATVLAAGTAPYGDLTEGTDRIGPVLFDRTLLCLKGTALKKTSCANPAHLDAWDHHSYGVGAPTRHALNANDVATPDIGKLTRIMRKAIAAGTVLPRRSKPMWMTEVSYDSNPPDPDGIPVKKQAAWLEQSFELLYRQGVHTALWFSITDSPPVPSYRDTYQAGLFLLNGDPKPAATAYTFPFVRDGSRVWGRAPLDGALVIEQKTSGGWRTLRKVTMGRHDVFDLAVNVSRSAVLRARQGTQTSLTWPVS
jgi:hypothetical protein